MHFVQLNIAYLYGSFQRPRKVKMPVCYCEAKSCASKSFLDEEGKQRRGQDLGKNEYADHQLFGENNNSSPGH